MTQAFPTLAICAVPAVAALFVQIAHIERARVLRIVAASLWFAAAAYSAVVLAEAAAFDAVGVTLSALTLFIAAIVVAFSQRHMRADRDLRGYARRIGFLVSAVLVTINAEHFAIFAAGWIASGWLLADAIGHVQGWQQAADAKARARRTFLASDAALIAGLALIWAKLEITRFDQLTGAVGGHGELTIAMLLILGAAVARCAVPPFHKWLMGSMAAPTPVSALMHAGLVNAGGLLLLRMSPALEAMPDVKLAAVAIGAIGALFGTGVMIVRPDVKRALGGSTLAQMSFMIMTCGLGAYAAALWHLVAHGLFKAWAFLGAGSNIGRAAPAALSPWSPLHAAVAAAGGIGLCWVAAASGFVDLPLPTVLALVAAFAAGANLLRADAARFVPVAAMTALLTATYLAGLGVIEALPGIAKGVAPFGLAGQLLLLAPFIGCWLWQSTRLPLPRALYVRMLNTGGPALIR